MRNASPTLAAGSASQAITHLRHASHSRPIQASKSQIRQLLSNEVENRLKLRLQQAIQNPTSRIYQPTFTGYLSEQMDPMKKAFDNQPSRVGHATRIPGQIGWGIERNHLRASSNLIADDSHGVEHPIPKHHLKSIDKHKTTLFTKLEGDRAHDLDRKLGLDYELYHAMNLQAQRSTLKALNAQRRFELSAVKSKPVSFDVSSSVKVPKKKALGASST